MPTITINGLAMEAKDGMTILQAAAQAGIEIPHYCYHPGLRTVGSCRMCQVEVAGLAKPQVACNTLIRDGMVVTTNNEAIQKAQKSVLEFLLVNHPLDCPVCDQAGECGLQDYYMRFGGNGSRLADNKLKRQKTKPLGPYVILDQDRCILCSRCVRFCREIPKTCELGIFNRGDHSVVDIYPTQELSNKYSGNVVDICPVGALTDRDFRFQVRVWYLREGDSICTTCSRGCNICAYYNPARRHHAGGRRIVRLKPRFNETVNKWWLCDEGRYNYRFMDDCRLQQPLRRNGNGATVLSWKEIISELAAHLKSVIAQFGPDAVAVLGSPQLPNEDLYLIRKFFRDKLGIQQVSFGTPGGKSGYSDDFLITADKNPNRHGAQAQGWPEFFDGNRNIAQLAVADKMRALIVFRQDLVDVFTESELAKLAGQLDLLAFVGTNECLLSQTAHFVLPVAVPVERDGTFINMDGLVQRFFRIVDPLGEALPDWMVIRDLAKAMGIDYGYLHCEALFKELAGSQAAFTGMTYSTIGNHGQALSVCRG